MRESVVTFSLCLAMGSDELTDKTMDVGVSLWIVFINEPTFMFPRLRLTASSSKGCVNFGSDIPDIDIEAVRGS